MRQDRLRGMEADVDRVTIRRRFRHEISRDRAARARAVFDNGGLAAFVQSLAKRSPAMSATPPGAVGTMILMGWDGYVWAVIGVGKMPMASTASANGATFRR